MNPRLADAVIEVYVCISCEDGQVAIDLLVYYLVEKAMIGMVIVIFDDKLKEGWERDKSNVVMAILKRPISGFVSLIKRYLHISGYLIGNPIADAMGYHYSLDKSA